MMHTRERCARLGRFSLILCLMLTVLAGPSSGASLSRAELYQATVPVADRSESAQSGAFEAAMRIVLVRITGRRNAGDDPALAPLVHGAQRYVQQYRAAGEGKLSVAFDGAALERWLTQNGQPVWGRTRPATLVLLAVQGPGGGSVITQEESSDLKLAVEAAAAERGTPLIWPGVAEHLDYASVAGTAASTLAESAHRLGGEGVLVGRASAPAATASIRWTFTYQDRSSEFSGDAAEGPNRAADIYAGVFAVSGAIAPVELEVTGMRELKDYALAESYLESLALVTHLSVEGLSGDSVRFKLMARGGADALGHAIALESRLQPIAPGEGGLLRFELHR